MVDKSNLPAFAVNESEKMHNQDISPMFIQQSGKRHFENVAPSAGQETPQSKVKGGMDPRKNSSQINLFQEQHSSVKRQSDPDLYYQGGGAMSLILSQVKENHKKL